MRLWTCKPPKVISLSLDFSFAGGDDLGTESSGKIQANSGTVKKSTNRGFLLHRQNPLCASSIEEKRGLVSSRVSNERWGYSLIHTTGRRTCNFSWVRVNGGDRLRSR